MVENLFLGSRNLDARERERFRRVIEAPVRGGISEGRAKRVAQVFEVSQGLPAGDLELLGQVLRVGVSAGADLSVDPSASGGEGAKSASWGGD